VGRKIHKIPKSAYASMTEVFSPGSWLTYEYVCDIAGCKVSKKQVNEELGRLGFLHCRDSDRYVRMGYRAIEQYKRPERLTLAVLHAAIKADGFQDMYSFMEIKMLIGYHAVRRDVYAHMPALGYEWVEKSRRWAKHESFGNAQGAQLSDNSA